MMLGGWKEAQEALADGGIFDHICLQINKLQMR